jgi:hypothetical protein
LCGRQIHFSQDLEPPPGLVISLPYPRLRERHVSASASASRVGPQRGPKSLNPLRQAPRKGVSVGQPHSPAMWPCAERSDQLKLFTLGALQHPE